MSQKKRKSSWKKWTKEERDWFRKNYPKLGCRETARILKRTNHAIECQARNLGIKVNPKTTYKIYGFDF